jgi:hypothetical protein
MRWTYALLLVDVLADGSFLGEALYRALIAGTSIVLRTGSTEVRIV